MNNNSIERYSSKSIDEMRRISLPLDIKEKMGLETGAGIILQRINAMVILRLADEEENPSTTIDQLGRITIPKELMQEMSWEIKSKVAIYYVDDKTVILR